MITIDNIYKNQGPLYPLEEYADPSKILYIDIETTGLAKESTSLYLIGCGYYSDSDFCTKLFFAENYDEELLLLNTFIDFSKKFTHLLHFNGIKFDIPYLEYKAKKYGIDGIFDHLEQIDIYYLCKPLRYLLFPQSMRQKCIEDFLEIERKDMYNGGELISVYHSYVEHPNDNDFDKLITHNLEDVLGMHKLTPILHYLQFKNTSLKYVSSKCEEYLDYERNKCRELYITYKSMNSFPKSFTSKTNTMWLWANAEDQTLIFRLPIIRTTMKRFFDNYRDYYFLPEKDSCIHKSVAMGLDKSQYIKACKNNCYINIEGEFIKQPRAIFNPVFKPEYKDKSSYFMYPDSFNEESADEFGNALLAAIINRKK